MKELKIKKDGFSTVQTTFLTATGLLCLSILIPSAWADHAKISLDQASEETSIVIKKGKTTPTPTPKDFQIITESEEVVGEPFPGRKESYESWKAQCDEWKKEVKELNKGNQIISLNCNSPQVTKENGLQTYRSSGTKTLKVRVTSVESEETEEEETD